MKKAISLLLALVMCLSLCACGGGNSAEKAIIGEWKILDGSDVLIFNEDGTVDRNGEKLDWWYDSDGERYCISYFGMTFNFVIQTENDIRFFTIENVPYYHADDYDKAIEANK